MLGLRTQETEKFNNFFKVIQTEAEKQGMVFFADTGDGNEFEFQTMEGENMMGWLVPKDKSDDFEKAWNAWAVDDSWSDFYKWAIWSMDGEILKISFEE